MSNTEIQLSVKTLTPCVELIKLRKTDQVKVLIAVTQREDVDFNEEEVCEDDYNGPK